MDVCCYASIDMWNDLPWVLCANEMGNHACDSRGPDGNCGVNAPFGANFAEFVFDDFQFLIVFIRSQVTYKMLQDFTGGAIKLNAGLCYRNMTDTHRKNKR